MARFALSTAWHAARTRDAAEILRVPARLGFEGIELSSVDSDVTDAVLKTARDGFPPIGSLHAPCPVPYPGAARLDDLASLDEARRGAAVDFTRRTVDFAAAIGARVVVLHLGTVAGTIAQPVIVEAMEAGLEDRWRVLLATGLAQRREGRDRHLERCLRSLETLSAHADGSGVYLGAETRYEYNDLPNLEEFGLILQTFGSRGVGYWHDVGHVHTQQTLGLATPRDYLDRYQSHLLGFHLHDARATRDHLPPGLGEADFEDLRAYARPEHLRVFEVAGIHPENQLTASLEFLKSLGL